MTGGNKGIGFEICKKLAANDIRVILTARNEKNGREAVEKLKSSGFPDVVFHQLDITDPASIAALASYVESSSGKLDILVSVMIWNNQNRWLGRLATRDGSSKRHGTHVLLKFYFTIYKYYLKICLVHP